MSKTDFLKRLNKELDSYTKAPKRTYVIPLERSSIPIALLRKNPSASRDLKARLQRLSGEQTRRRDGLDWQQRQFFIQQTFDTESHLRFPGPSGVFLPPLVENEDSESPENDSDVVHVVADSETSSNRPNICRSLTTIAAISKPPEKSYKKKELVSGREVSFAPTKTFPKESKRIKPYSTLSPTTAQEPSDSSLPPVSKTFRKPTSKSAHAAIPPSKTVSGLQLSPRATTPPQTDSILRPEIVSRLMRTLPTSLAQRVKEHTALAAEEQRSGMLRRLKSSMEKRCVSDPRWAGIERSLVAPPRNPKYDWL